MATDYYRLRVQGLHQTEYNEVVMHFKGVNLTAADYRENAQDLLDSWDGGMLGLWLPTFPSSYQVLRISATKASAGGGSEVSKQYAFGTQVGGRSGGAASQQLCPIVRLIPPMGIKTAGRMFLPAVAESDANANVLSATFLANVGNYMADAIGGFGTATIVWTQSIYSRVNNVFSDVVAYDTSPIIGFQRRRQRSPL